MKTDLRNGERVIKEGAANLQKNIETVGGRLYLTNQRVIFESHQFNVQDGTAEVDITNIQSAEPSWTKFLGFLPIFPNSLSIYTKQGKEYRFVLFGRGAWAAAISATNQVAVADKKFSSPVSGQEESKTREVKNKSPWKVGLKFATAGALIAMIIVNAPQEFRSSLPNVIAYKIMGVLWLGTIGFFVGTLFGFIKK